MLLQLFRLDLVMEKLFSAYLMPSLVLFSTFPSLPHHHAIDHLIAPSTQLN
jgi:hypothetical protein